MLMNVLLIEDHKDLAASVREFLTVLGHRVQWAADGSTGWKLARQESFDAIILDRLLPKLDGTLLCKRLRADGHKTPVLMLTALDSLEQKLEGFAAGADDYLPKPFALAELRARLDALHRRNTADQGQRQISVADLVLDLDALQAKRAGQTLTLNPTTRKLLEYLMRETHRVVPRAELEELLWGKAVPVDDVLRVHMHALRAAVDKPYPRKLIHTVHGVGYRLAESNDP